MSRYIDVEWLMNFFVDIPNNFTLTIGNLRATVNDAPSIDIVRCQDCKHWNMVSNGCMRNPSVEGWQADDFCSYGQKERASDESRSA